MDHYDLIREILASELIDRGVKVNTINKAIENITNTVVDYDFEVIDLDIITAVRNSLNKVIGIVAPNAV